MNKNCLCIETNEKKHIGYIVCNIKQHYYIKGELVNYNIHITKTKCLTRA